jgi:hypothetical protein
MADVLDLPAKVVSFQDEAKECLKLAQAEPPGGELRVSYRTTTEEMIGRLHRATQTSMLELVAALQANRRASLAMHCYRRPHLRQAALTVASTCDLITLVRVCGPLRGEAIFAQSRLRPNKPRGRGRSRPSLACSTGGTHCLPADVDDTLNCEKAVPA